MANGPTSDSDRRHLWRIGRLVCVLAAAMALMMAALPAVASAAVNTPTETSDPATPSGPAGSTVTFTVTFSTTGTTTVNDMSYTLGASTATPATGVATCLPRTTGNASSGTFTFTALLINTGSSQTLRVRFFSNSTCSTNSGTTTANSTFSLTTVRVTSTTALPASASNPTLTTGCGTLRVMLVLDESASILAPDADLVKQAAEHFVAGLKDTGTELAISAFAVGARNLISYRLVDDATESSFQNAIDEFARDVPISRSGTNWDAAFSLVRTDDETEGPPPNLVLFMTDGNPNTIGIPPDHSNPTENVAGWEAATPASIEAANSVKDQGSRIFAIGLGSYLDEESGSIDRLRSISGDSESGTEAGQNPDFFTSDWVHTKDFAAFRTILSTIVSRLCGSSLVITKWVSHLHGQGWTVAQGWKFKATLDTPHDWLTPDVGTSHSATETTNDDGVAEFHWVIPNGGDTATLGVTDETEKPGFHFVLARCELHKLNADGEYVVTDHPPGGSTTGIPGAVLRATEFMTCDVYNSPGEPGGGGGDEIHVVEPEDAPHLVTHKTMPAQAHVGEHIPITITVHNHGTGPAHGVMLHETPPDGSHIIHAADGGTIEADGTVVWHIGTLKAGETRTVHATMVATRPGHFLNTAVADTEDGDPAVYDAPEHVRPATHPPSPPPPAVTG